MMLKKFFSCLITIIVLLSCVGPLAVSAELTPETALPPYNPPANEHPRVYFRKADLPRIMTNLESEENKSARELVWRYAKDDINVGTKYSNAVLQRAEAKALCYQLYGNAEEGRQAIDAMLKTEAWDDIKEGMDNTRRFGACIEILACVYDWCYDLTTANERKKLISMAENWASNMEMGWPPNKQGSLIGHGAEAQLLRDDMSFAIAVYDERPDIWNYVGGSFYENFVPERKWHQPSRINHQGNNYGPYRNIYSAYAYLLITGMGAPEPYDGYDVGTHAYSHNIYARRPDGTMFLNGDMWEATPMKYNNGNADQLLLECACSKDGLVKDELFRMTRNVTKDGTATTSIAVSPTKWILFNQPQVKRASREGMPLSYYFGSPMGVMYARTGWQEGVDSPAAVAEMTIGEYWFGNHQHKDAGSFQLYYKGPLATESGFYQNGVWYGSNDHTNYTMQSIAHNCMLVYDPNEDMIDFNNKHINDGGQRWPMGVMQSNYKNILNDSKHKRAIVEAEEIDPQNPMVPLYTYMKGNLANAYSDKVSSYKRSFMFLNLWDQKTPAALIVFDRLRTSNPKFEKTWLLHGQQNPEISGNRLIWKSNPYVDKTNGQKYTGKMIQDSLLPSSKVEMKIASGPDIGWNTVRGTDFTHPNKSPDREENTYRLEISPTDNKETDYFLNVMQVTDESNGEYYMTQLMENNDMYGVKIKDRVVMFSKSGKKLSNKQVISGGNAKYMICDMLPGTYKITGGSKEQTAKVSQKGGVLSFDFDGDSATIEKVSSEAAQNNEIRNPNGAKSTIVKIDGNLALLGTEVEMVNDKLMVSAEDLAIKMGLERTNNGDEDIYTDSKQQITVSIKCGCDYIVKNGERINLVNKSYDRNGILMTELRAFAEAFNYVVNWDNLTEGVYMTADKKIKISGEKLAVYEVKDHESVKAKSTVFVEAESAEKIESGEIYDTRKFMSGGAGITEHNKENTSLKYTVDISEDGDYKFAVKYVAWMDGDTIRNLVIDGKTYNITLPKTASWGADPMDWIAAVSEKSIRLSKGKHSISLTVVNNMWNVDWFSFIK